MQNAQFSGIWGLGFSGNSAWGGETSFDFLVAQAGIPNSFSMCLNEANPTLVIGEDMTNVQGVQFTPMVSQIAFFGELSCLHGIDQFSVTLDDISLNGQSLGVSSEVLSNSPFCLVDSGTTEVVAACNGIQ